MRFVNSWVKYKTWHLVKPPSRPDIWQLDICRNTLLSLPRLKNVAVLGSTIEYRELLAEMDSINVFVFDRNRSFYDYSIQFIKKCIKETFVDGNWLETLFEYVGFFDVVLSDLTSGNIPYEHRETFYKGIADSMSKNAIFIDRLLSKRKPFLNIDELIKKYSNLPVSNDTVNNFNCEVLFCSTLLNNKEMIVDSSVIYDYLLDLNIPQITDFVIACYDITPRDCVWWYSQPWDIEWQLYTNFFCILEEYHEPINSDYYGRTKLLISSSKRYL
jgi:hypothetical protein